MIEAPEPPVSSISGDISVIC